MTCSSDKKSKLACSSGKWKVEEPCKKPCEVEDATIECDTLGGCVMIPRGASCAK